MGSGRILGVSPDFGPGFPSSPTELQSRGVTKLAPRLLPTKHRFGKLGPRSNHNNPRPRRPFEPICAHSDGLHCEPLSLTLELWRITATLLTALRAGRCGGGACGRHVIVATSAGVRRRRGCAAAAIALAPHMETFERDFCGSSTRQNSKATVQQRARNKRTARSRMAARIAACLGQAVLG